MEKEEKKKSVYLPLELIGEILLKLPVKILLCCRCVSKSWLSLISHNNFATSHFQLATTHSFVFVNSSGLKFVPIDGDTLLPDDSAYASTSLDFVLSQHSLEVGGFCRGFLYLHSDTDFLLWNPSTGAHKQIPAHPITPMIKLLTRLELLSGFAYDHSTDDYLIVSVFCEDNDLAIKLMIFSLRANKWKPIEVASHLPYMMTRVWYCFRKCGLFLNGSIHWMVHNYETSKNVIIAFDIKEMTISEIALPDDFIFSYSNNYSIYYDLLVVGGLISAWVNDLNTVKIWVMQEYGVHSSWTAIIQFSVDPVLHKDLYIACLTKCGDIVGRNSESGLVKFNDKGKLLEKHLCHMYCERSDSVVYTESLFSLPGGTSQTY